MTQASRGTSCLGSGPGVPLETCSWFASGSLPPVFEQDTGARTKAREFWVNWPVGGQLGPSPSEGRVVQPQSVSFPPAQCEPIRHTSQPAVERH